MLSAEWSDGVRWGSHTGVLTRCRLRQCVGCRRTELKLTDRCLHSEGWRAAARHACIAATYGPMFRCGRCID